MTGNRIGNWQTRLLQPRWGRTALHPADVSAGLQSALLSREAMLEDANYQKVVPNHFVVEVGPERYAAEYQPIEQRLVQQWSERLLEHLMTINSRLGRKEYIFGGRVRIEVRPAENLPAEQVRIHYRIEPSTETDPQGRAAPACLELVPSGRRIALRGDPFTMGRDPACTLSLDAPAVLERRLVSSVHATIRTHGGEYLLSDGAPDGRPSLNGTYLNGRRLAEGEAARLQPGDTIQLAAVDPDQPRPDTPGVVVLRFQRQC